MVEQQMSFIVISREKTADQYRSDFTAFLKARGKSFFTCSPYNSSSEVDSLVTIRPQFGIEINNYGSVILAKRPFAANAAATKFRSGGRSDSGGSNSDSYKTDFTRLVYLFSMEKDEMFERSFQEFHKTLVTMMEDGDIKKMLENSISVVTRSLDAMYPSCVHRKCTEMWNMASKGLPIHGELQKHFCLATILIRGIHFEGTPGNPDYRLLTEVVKVTKKESRPIAVRYTNPFYLMPDVYNFETDVLGQKKPKGCFPVDQIRLEVSLLYFMKGRNATDESVKNNSSFKLKPTANTVHISKRSTIARTKEEIDELQLPYPSGFRCSGGILPNPNFSHFKKIKSETMAGGDNHAAHVAGGTSKQAGNAGFQLRNQGVNKAKKEKERNNNLTTPKPATIKVPKRVRIQKGPPCDGKGKAAKFHGTPRTADFHRKRGKAGDFRGNEDEMEHEVLDDDTNDDDWTHSKDLEQIEGMQRYHGVKDVDEKPSVSSRERRKDKGSSSRGKAYLDMECVDDKCGGGNDDEDDDDDSDDGSVDGFINDDEDDDDDDDDDDEGDDDDEDVEEVEDYDDDDDDCGGTRRGKSKKNNKRKLHSNSS
jgi:hypothetical protein